MVQLHTFASTQSLICGNVMLSNRIFRVFKGNKSSRPRVLKNGLPYFNVYSSDMPPTISRKFTFAEDLTLVTQVKSFRKAEENLGNDLWTMQKYDRKWCLCLNDEKTEVSIFHLDNHSVSRELDVYIDGVRLTHNSTPICLGLPLWYRDWLVRIGEQMEIYCVQRLFRWCTLRQSIVLRFGTEAPTQTKWTYYS